MSIDLHITVVLVRCCIRLRRHIELTLQTVMSCFVPPTVELARVCFVTWVTTKTLNTHTRVLQASSPPLLLQALFDFIDMSSPIRRQTPKWAARSRPSFVSPRPSLSTTAAVTGPTDPGASVEDPNSVSGAVHDLPPEVSGVNGPPRFKWWEHLKKGIDALRSWATSSVGGKEVGLTTKRTVEIRAPLEAVVEDQALANQWMMRYSEDNVALASLEISHLISMVLGMPILVHYVDSTMAIARFLLHPFFKMCFIQA